MTLDEKYRKKTLYPYWGSKTKVGHIIWDYIGDVDKFIDPFGGSFSTLLTRPKMPRPNQYEIMNDIYGVLVNTMRAIKYAPDLVAEGTRQIPRSSVEAWSRAANLKLADKEMVTNLISDKDWYDIDKAVDYLYIMALQLGNSYLLGGWAINSDTGKFAKIYNSNDPRGIQGTRISVRNSSFYTTTLSEQKRYYRWLSKRLERVSILCGNWDAPLSSATALSGNGHKNGKWTTGIVLDPPYAGNDHNKELYIQHDLSVSAKVRNRAIELSQDPRFKICICGYIEEHDEHLPSDWIRVPWKASKGYATQNKKRENTNRFKEMLWFSPSCKKPDKYVDNTQSKLF